ncbi:MAG: hypothetical protein SynsKO_25640 [Synoicihabitans sp.]
MITLFQRRRFRSRTAVLGAALAWSIIWIGALQFAPTAHADIHHDAHEADHHCVIEVFSEGVLSGEISIEVHAPSTALHIEAATAEVVYLDTPDRLRPPGRAPPLG